ncbi:MAG: hypothetical protein EBU54_15635 [Mycobacteriaceae bacterium]|nr:hypothetical protein [Mycobacteriaceae bacterium]
MELFLAHIPHIALIAALALLFVRMEIGERRMRAVAVAGGDIEAAEARAMGVRGAVRTLLLLVLLAAVAVLVVQALRGVDPSGFIVFDYLVAGGILAVWFAWSTPQAMAPGVRSRLGGFGRFVVRFAVLVVALGGVIIAGMALAHGVLLPAL